MRIPICVQRGVFRLLFSAAFCLVAFSTVPAFADGVQCKPIPANTPVSPAEQAYRDGDTKKALELFQQALAAHPEDMVQMEGAVRSAIRLREFTTAEKLVTTHQDSKSDWAMLAASEYYTSQGQLERAQQAVAMALAANLCNAQAHLHEARLNRYSSMYAKAKKQVDTAYMLDKSDPAITSAWLNQQALPFKIAYYKSQSEDQSIPADKRDSASQAVEYYTSEAEAKHSCRMTSVATSTSMDMAPIMEDGANIRGWGLDVGINGHSTRMFIDTGASGLIINRGAAERAGLKPFSRSSFFGIGNKGTQKAFAAYADHLRVGNFEFTDCIVQISDSKTVGTTQGLLGMNMFRDYVVQLDFPLRKFSLNPLPGPPAEAKTLETDDDDEANMPPVPHDRYTGPEVKDYLPVYRMGSSIILPVLLNSKPELLEMDTGSDNTYLNKDVAKDFTSLTSDKSRGLIGVSGVTHDVFVTGTVKIQFGPIAQIQNGTMALDLHNFHTVRVAGLLGASFLYNLVVDINYRDGLVKFFYDRNHGANAWRSL